MDQEKLHAVAALSASGKSVRQIAAATGIAKSTVQDVKSSDSAVLIINDLRPKIAAHLSQEMLAMVTSPDFKPKPTELAVVWGIAMDKFDKSQQTASPSPITVIVQGSAQILQVNAPDQA